MTREQMLTALTDKIDELLGGEIKKLPEYPYNPDAAKALVAIERIISMNPLPTVNSCAAEENTKLLSLYTEDYRKQQQVDYINALQNRYEGRPIMATDILRVLGKLKVTVSCGSNAITLAINTDGFIIVEECEAYGCGLEKPIQIDLLLPLHEQSQSTVAELYKLFFE